MGGRIEQNIKGNLCKGLQVKYNVKERDEVEELNTYVHANMKNNIIYCQTLVLYLLLTWFVEVEQQMVFKSVSYLEPLLYFSQFLAPCSSKRVYSFIGMVFFFYCYLRQLAWLFGIPMLFHYLFLLFISLCLAYDWICSLFSLWYHPPLIVIEGYFS